MLIKVKHNELKDVSKTLVKDSEAYDAEITNMLSSIDTLRDIWQGEDATEFCDNVSDFLSRMNNITVAMKNMSNAINTIDSGYLAYDDVFSSSLKEEAGNYDE